MRQEVGRKDFLLTAKPLTEDKILKTFKRHQGVNRKTKHIRLKPRKAPTQRSAQSSDQACFCLRDTCQSGRKSCETERAFGSLAGPWRQRSKSGPCRGRDLKSHSPFS